MANTTIYRTGGISLSSALGITFIVLKLCGVISWSWWWVLSPFWIPFAVIIAVLFIIIAVIVIASLKDQ